MLLNYIFIQSAILAFFTPFYSIYRHDCIKNEVEDVSFNQHLECFFRSRQANYLVFIWAASEAVVWFVIPEFLLFLAIFLRIKNKIQLLIYDILGTSFGTVLALLLPLHSTSEMLKIPYVRENMIQQVEVWYQYMGLFGLIFQPFSGIPYKIFTLTASKYGFFLPAFILLGILVRISRYYIFYLIFTGIHPLLHRFVYQNYILIFLVGCFIFSLLLLKVYNVYGSDYQIDYTFIEKLQYIRNLISGHYNYLSFQVIWRIVK